jgi:uncharacterized protein (DUF302 family)
MSYYQATKLTCSYDQAVGQVREALKKQGFGVLTEINLSEKFREKLGRDFRPYVILGACNPAYAFDALSLEDKIGTMLPCNVIVQEHAPGEVEVAAIDPLASMKAVDNPRLHEVAARVRDDLAEAVRSLAS